MDIADYLDGLMPTMADATLNTVRSSYDMAADTTAEAEPKGFDKGIPVMAYYIVKKNGGEVEPIMGSPVRSSGKYDVAKETVLGLTITVNGVTNVYYVRGSNGLTRLKQGENTTVLLDPMRNLLIDSEKFLRDFKLGEAESSAEIDWDACRKVVHIKGDAFESIDDAAIAFGLMYGIYAVNWWVRSRFPIEYLAPYFHARQRIQIINGPDPQFDQYQQLIEDPESGEKVVNQYFAEYGTGIYGVGEEGAYTFNEPNVNFKQDYGKAKFSVAPPENPDGSKPRNTVHSHPPYYTDLDITPDEFSEPDRINAAKRDNSYLITPIGTMLKATPATWRNTEVCQVPFLRGLTAHEDADKKDKLDYLLNIDHI